MGVQRTNPRSEAPIGATGGETMPLSRSVIDDHRAAFATWPTLVASHADGAQVIRLAPGRPVVVGRAAPSDLVVSSAHLSRCHARFTLVDEGVEVIDLDSANGTVVRGEAVERAVVAAGEVVLLGKVRVTLQRLDDDAPASIAGDGLMRAWIEDEVTRSRHFGRTFAVLHVRAANEAHVAEGWLPFVKALLRPVDRVALHGGAGAWALLPEVSRDDARATALAMARAHHEHAPLLVGFSSYPAAASAERVLDEARSAARRARIDRPVCDGSAPPDPPSTPSPTPDLVVVDPRMRAVVTTLERVAASALPVLLLGETGSGKEVAARVLHAHSPRRGGSLVPVNCGAIPANLVESTLFGHEKGAFTGALSQHKGVFEAAHGGTVFLDEIGELPLVVQAALLRVLETRRVCRVGSTQEIAVDVRIVAATHRDLEAHVREGKFREDLLFRLETMIVRLPPLRDRPADVMPLAEAMLAAAARPARPKRLSTEAREAVQAYRWPGNVRELKNAMDRATVVSLGDIIALEDLPERMLRAVGRDAVPAAPPDPLETTVTGDDAALDLRTRLAKFEASVIVDALRAAGGRQARAAELLGLPLRTLKYKLRALGIRHPSSG